MFEHANLWVTSYITQVETLAVTNQIIANSSGENDQLEEKILVDSTSEK